MDTSSALTSPGLSSPAPTRSLRILLVEDSATMRLFLSRQLNRLYPQSQVIEAEDGKSAIRQLAAHSVDLVITDLRMPGMDGEGLVQLLKRNPLLKKKPVLVVSAEADTAAAAQWASEPGLLILAKPVDPLRLHAAVEALISVD